jgi:hypothetical protein
MVLMTFMVTIYFQCVTTYTLAQCKAAGLTTRIEDMETLKQNNIDTKIKAEWMLYVTTSYQVSLWPLITP